MSYRVLVDTILGYERLKGEVIEQLRMNSSNYYTVGWGLAFEEDFVEGNPNLFGKIE